MRATIFLIALCALFVVRADESPQAPYVQAISLALKLHDGPDKALLDWDAPLDARTSAIIQKNEQLFALLHAAAGGEQTDWGAASADMPVILKQLNGARALANLGVLRARLLFKDKQTDAAVESLMDVMALARNMSRDTPTLISQLASIGIEELAMTKLAEAIPSLPADETAKLAERLKKLPEAGTMADTIRAERKFGAALLVQQLPGADGAKAAGAMAPLYDATIEAVDQTPPPSLAEFKQKLSDAVGKIDVNTDPISKGVSQPLVSSFASFYSTNVMHRTRLTMLNAGIAISVDGPAAAKSFPDPQGGEPFEYDKTDGGFELVSKLMGRDQKPVTMRFGK